MKIKNYKELSKTPLRAAALKIAEAGLQSVDTEKIINQLIRLEKNILYIRSDQYRLADLERILIVGIGKCSLEAAAALEKILGEKIHDGIVVDTNSGSLKKIRVITGDHPFPTQRNIDATKEIINLLNGLNENDLVIFMISGGGSTLLCQPKDMTCYDEANILRCLFDSGADIQKINLIRKHISLARGGYLAKYAYPANVISLIFSDVPGDNLEFVASGPTIKDTTTVNQAEKIIKDYEIKNKCSLAEIQLFETPKEEKYFTKVKNILTASNKIALDAMAKEAEKLNFKPIICTSCLSGEAKDVGISIIEQLESKQSKTALLYGGETTVTIKKPGKGGRSLELGLSALQKIKEGLALLPFASDGKDNTDFAGAICDMETKKKALAMNLDIKAYLENNDSYGFFEKTKDYVSTDDTGSNVSDLIVALKE
ncbi:DUF4147 domain-containing protein [Candidatus Parcubacteria bacterium]|nr:MAG: DUF4147 domain-containing protein [Candidatus Parcubacteria bacterium]